MAFRAQRGCYYRARGFLNRVVPDDENLGAHAQRGLQYLVCVSVCLSVTTFSATARNNAPNEIYQRLQRDMSKVLKMAFSLKMLHSGVTVTFAYAAKSAIFCYTCEHVHTGTRPRGLFVA